MGGAKTYEIRILGKFILNFIMLCFLIFLDSFKTIFNEKLLTKNYITHLEINIKIIKIIMIKQDK